MEIGMGNPVGATMWIWLISWGSTLCMCVWTLVEWNVKPWHFYPQQSMVVRKVKTCDHCHTDLRLWMMQVKRCWPSLHSPCPLTSWSVGHTDGIYNAPVCTFSGLIPSVYIGYRVCNRTHIRLYANRLCYSYARASSNHYWFLTGKSETGRQPTIYIYYYSTVRKRSTTPNQLVLPFVADGMKSWRKISASSNYDDLETNLRNIHTWDTNTKLPINAERNSNIYL